MSKTIVTYLIKITDSNLYVTNRPTEQNSTIKYSTERSDAREFNGMEDAAVDMTFHTAIKKTVTETTEYEEVEVDGWT